MTDCRVWIDIRLFTDGAPFCELQSVAGFPRLLRSEESVEVETSDQDILYRRSKFVADASVVPCFLPATYRVDCALLLEGMSINIGGHD